MESNARFSTAGIARLSARRPWRTIGLWLLVLVLAGLSASTLNDALTTDTKQLNNPESQRGADLLEQRLRGEKPISETIIVRSETATVDDAAFKATVDGLVAELKAIPDVTRSVDSFYSTGNAALVSADRHSTIVSVVMNGTLDEAIDRVPDYEAALASAQKDDYQILSVGDATLSEEFNTIADEDLAKGEMIGIPVAILILIVLLGALVAAGLPIVVGFVSIFIAMGLAALAGRATDLSFFVVNMIFMIGLAVGIDYALFIISRYREERARGLDKYAAIAVTGGTASKAVLFSGGTVVLALSGMFLVPELTFRSLGIGAVLVVVVAVAASLTLLPALLSVAGDKINWPRLGRKKNAVVTDPHTITYKGFWGRVTKRVMAHPVVALVLSVGVLLAFALPVVDMNRGASGVSSLPKSTEAYAAYSLLERDFPAGMIAPVEIVVDGSVGNPKVQGSIEALTASLAADSRFGPVSVQHNEAGDLALVSVPLTLEPDNPAAYATIDDLREQIVPSAFASAPAEVLVAGQVAITHDGNTLSEEYLPIVIAFVLSLSFILLTVAFRSIVVPIKALIMNLLSVGAAYGLIVLVFQKGYGANLFGFQTVPMIESWLPLFLFSILFGLSMDYHVFLLSRIREHYDLTKNNKEAVAFGLQSTAKLITGAALIMVVVFAGFAAGRLVMLQQVGFGLAVAILIDATIVRSILVPASMVLLGDRNWYFPKWLNWLPHVTIEGHVPSIPSVAPAFAASSTSGDD